MGSPPQVSTRQGLGALHSCHEVHHMHYPQRKATRSRTGASVINRTVIGPDGRPMVIATWVRTTPTVPGTPKQDGAK